MRIAFSHYEKAERGSSCDSLFLYRDVVVFPESSASVGSATLVSHVFILSLPSFSYLRLSVSIFAWKEESPCFVLPGWPDAIRRVFTGCWMLLVLRGFWRDESDKEPANEGLRTRLYEFVCACKILAEYHGKLGAWITKTSFYFGIF